MLGPCSALFSQSFWGQPVCFPAERGLPVCSMAGKTSNSGLFGPQDDCLRPEHGPLGLSRPSADDGVPAPAPCTAPAHGSISIPRDRWQEVAVGVPSGSRGSLPHRGGVGLWGALFLHLHPHSGQAALPWDVYGGEEPRLAEVPVGTDAQGREWGLAPARAQAPPRHLLPRREGSSLPQLSRCLTFSVVRSVIPNS